MTGISASRTTHVRVGWIVRPIRNHSLRQAALTAKLEDPMSEPQPPDHLDLIPHRQKYTAVSPHLSNTEAPSPLLRLSLSARRERESLASSHSEPIDDHQKAVPDVG